MTAVPGPALAITPADLLVVVADLWEATFGCAVAETATAPDGTSGWWASVDLLDGDGVVAEVVLVTDEETLARVASHTFGVEHPSADQVADVAAEAANIIGGNVKGILALRTRLSWPRADRGAPSLGDRPRTTVHAVDDRGRHTTVHVIHTRAAIGTGPAPADRPYQEA